MIAEDISTPFGTGTALSIPKRTISRFRGRRNSQAMPVLIHSARRGKNSAVIFLSALLVEGSAVSAGRKPPLVDFTGPEHLRMVYLAVAVICWAPLRPPSSSPAEGQAAETAGIGKSPGFLRKPGDFFSRQKRSQIYLHGAGHLPGEIGVVLALAEGVQPLGIGPRPGVVVQHGL